MLFPEISFHLRLRQRDLKIKHAFLILISAVLLIFYLTRDYYGTRGYGYVSARTTDSKEDGDKIVALKAEIGYLKHKLSRCGGSHHVGNSGVEHHTPLYVITPTYDRPVQLAELSRLVNVFLMVPNLHWIVVEDAPEKTAKVTKFISDSGLSYTHLNIATPSDMKLKPKDPHWSKPRGVFQRNAALSWLRENFKAGDPGVVYFADDDNSYSLRLFEEIALTEKVSVFPVGLVGGVMVERPVTSEEGTVTGWSVGWGLDRWAHWSLHLQLLICHLIVGPLPPIWLDLQSI